MIRSDSKTGTKMAIIVRCNEFASNAPVMCGMEKVKMNEIEVSIVCNAYNHEAFIRNALEGFVKQKTTFPFEVLVHDDASTDGTAGIIREFEEKYPELIKPIYETENQYSKHDGSLLRIQYGRVKGKYIAVCEGDDYWIDPLKLQKQYDALEANPQIDICATGAKLEKDGKISGVVSPASTNKFFSTEEVILGGGGFVATASLMYRSTIRKNPPPFLQLLSLDYSVQIAGALRGGMIYLAEPTCVYRLLTSGSWTERMSHNLSAVTAHRQKVNEMLRCLDEYTLGKFHFAIDELIKSNEFSIFVVNHDYESICLKDYRTQFKAMPIHKQVVIKIGKYFPKAANYIWNLKARRG